jgi:GH15 family glucan-1,4-alpha-glucosidase
LDDEKGGHFDITPKGDYKIVQKYIKDTNVLETTFKGKKDAFRILDFFPCYIEGGELKNIKQLHRLLVIDKGKPNVRITYAPKLDYARATTKIKKTKGQIRATKGGDSLNLYSNIDLKSIGKKEVKLSEDSFFILGWGTPVKSPSIKLVEEEKEKTVKYWKDYVAGAGIPKYQRDEIVRSILALKLLTFHDSGGVVASATASIPEITGLARNFDKRYCWVKDQPRAIDALTSACLFDEARGVMDFLTSIGMAYMMKSYRYGFGMPNVYRPGGESFLEEQELSNLKGNSDSPPVRIGNDAHKLRHIAVFGEIMDAIYKFFLKHEYSERILDSHPALIKRMVEQAAKNWKEKDSGPWEFKDKEEHFTTSKLLSWVAIDRGIVISKRYNMQAPLEEWTEIRSEIEADIMESYNKKAATFTILADSEGLDTSLLLMSEFGFLAPGDDKFENTVKAIEKGLKVGSFLRPYSGGKRDAIEGPKVAYLQSALWLVDAFHAMGEDVKAKVLLEKIVRQSNHLGLFSEGIDLVNHKNAGNFPSAPAHIAFITTAIKLSGQKPGKTPKSTSAAV